MSTANVVPETFALKGGDARRTLSRARIALVLNDSVARFRWADGFSHARALAFQTVLTLVPGVIVAVGFATVVHQQALSDTIVRSSIRLRPARRLMYFERLHNKDHQTPARTPAVGRWSSARW